LRVEAAPAGPRSPVFKDMDRCTRTCPLRARRDGGRWRCTALTRPRGCDLLRRLEPSARAGEARRGGAGLRVRQATA
jgi:hypothetical protein